MHISPRFENRQLSGFVIELIGEEDIRKVQQLFQKALNCWPDSPKELKEMSDYMMYGKSLQDYTLYERENPGKTPANVTG